MRNIRTPGSHASNLRKRNLGKNLKFSLFLCIPFHSMQHQSQKDGSLVVAGVFYSEYLMYSHAITLKCNRKRRKRKKEPSFMPTWQPHVP